MPLLDIDTEEAVRAGRSGVAPGVGHATFVQAGFEDKEGFFEIRADYFLQACYYFSIRRLLCAFEEKSTSLDLGLVIGCRGRGEEVEDSVVVDFIHADDDSIFGGRVDIDR